MSHPESHRIGPHLDIGVIISSLGLIHGGLESWAAHVSGALAERGHRVYGICGYWPGRRIPLDLQNLPVTWIRVPCVPLNLPIWDRIFSSKHSFSLLKIQSLSFYYASRLYPYIRQLMSNLAVTLTVLEIETEMFYHWRE